MLNIKRYFFCDEVSRGNFGKVNFIGYFPNSQIINVNNIPYVLTTNLVLEGIFIAHILGGLEIQAHVLQANQSVFASTITLTESIPKGTSFILSFPIMVNVINYGSIDVKIRALDFELYSFNFTIENGLSPNYFVGKLLPTFGSIQPLKGNNFSIDNLLESATTDLLIIDGYLDPDFLIKTLSKSKHKPSIRILTYHKLSSKYKNRMSEIIQINASTVVKFSDNYHDRFCLINNTELYIFGHSLKDLNKNKTSFYLKVINQLEAEKVVADFESIWRNLPL
ncbi:MAG: hypothetical protein O9264_06650 [Leptospira sp.]|nr:hypothetical protein [Leptospira sp.]